MAQSDYESLEEIKLRGTPQFPIGFYVQRSASVGSILHFHWHKEWQWLYLVEGTAQIMIDNTKYKLNAGESIFVYSGRLHSGITENPNGCILMSIIFHHDIIYSEPEQVRAALSDFMEGRSMPHTIYHNNSAGEKKINTFLQEIYHLYNNPSVGNEIMIRARMYDIMAVILDEHLYIKTENHIQHVESVETNYVLLYIHSHYAEKIQLAELAKNTHMSPQALCRLFKRETGTTIIEYLNTYRIYNAAMLLRSTDKSINEIAEKCGFDTPSYFIKVFKRLRGITPATYRENESEMQNQYLAVSNT